MSDDKRMNISNEAVEAALSALFPDRETVSDFTRAVQEPAILTILDAAAPHLMAVAWDEGVAYVFEGGAEVSDENPYRHAGAGE